MSDETWMIVGLGNPGSRYEGTRHNAGQLVLAELALRAGLRFGRHRRAHAEVATGRIDGRRVELLQPRSYMNESGGPVAAAMAYEKLAPAQLIVIHDDLDLDFGKLRLKFGGGDGGHNGLKSLRQSLGTGEFYRVRFGIGRPPDGQDPADYVLRPFGSGQRREVPELVAEAAAATESLVSVGLAVTQQRYHSR